MHWAIAISFVLLLLTIFLRLTWLNKYNVADIIQDYLGEKEPVMSKEELVVLAKKIRKPMWEWHVYLGYVLTGLFALRFVLPMFGKMKFQNPMEKDLPFKVKLKKWSYLVFYVFVFLSLVTGLIIEFGPKTFKKTMESIHELALYYLIPFLVLHFSGVLWAEFTDEKGLISRMISGGDSFKEDK